MYLLAAFDRSAGYVVRDFLADAPVAVAHDPEAGRTRAFRGPAGEPDQLPLSLWWRAGPGGGLLHDCGGRLSDQDGRAAAPGPGPDRLPYDAVPVAATTWGEWRAAHPGTSVYVGADGLIEIPVVRTAPVTLDLLVAGWSRPGRSPPAGAVAGAAASGRLSRHGRVFSRNQFSRPARWRGSSSSPAAVWAVFDAPAGSPRWWEAIAR